MERNAKKEAAIKQKALQELEEQHRKKQLAKLAKIQTDQYKQLLASKQQEKHQKEIEPVKVK